MLKKLLGIGLSSKISHYKAKYRDGLYTFDHEHIIARISQSLNKFHMAACSYCDSPHEGGYDISNIVWIYRSRSFQSEEEAMAHLVKEVRIAQKEHPYTQFYRINFKNGSDTIEKYSNGKWQDSEWKGWV